MKQSRIFRSLFSVTGIILLGKLLGFVKQAVTASAFGATIETDLISLSQNFIGDIQYLLTQVLLVSFTTLYIHTREKDELTAKQFTTDTIKVFSLISSAFTIMILLAAPAISRIIAPSYPTELSLRLSRYLRLFSPVLILFSWTAIFHSLLNASRRFIPGELISVNQSVIQIVLVLLFQHLFGVKTLLFSFFSYTVWNVFYLGFLSRRYCLSHSHAHNPFQNPSVRKLLRMAGPLFLGYSVVYVNQQVDKIISSSLESGTVTAMGYAAVLSNLVSTFIVSFCSILFTDITTCISQDNHQGAASLTVRAASLLTLFFLPVSILTILSAQDIVAIVFGRGAFDSTAVHIASQALAGYGLMFVPLIFRELFSRLQYGYQDSRMPMLSSTISIVTNIFLSIALCPYFGVLGITAASSVSIVICGILNVIFAKRLSSCLLLKPLLHQLPFFIIGGIVCCFISLWLSSALADYSPLLRFTASVFCAGGGYFLVVSPLLWSLLRNQSS